jgi:hypothetical protein
MVRIDATSKPAQMIEVETSRNVADQALEKLPML